ncbi:MAG: ABC transporter ATP-binding protein [Anaerolineales bacterium]|nr:ABC transporter ATP-binding protein [Anaerolineales bacterium]
MLRLDGVSVSIGAVGILRNVSLEVQRGEFAGLIGRNGAGKTTLLRTVMGLLPFWQGTLAFEGEALARVPTHARVRLGIGYMPEDRRLVPGLTVEENVLLPAWSAKFADADARLARVYAAIPEVHEFRARRALQLSGGQQKLVALARAMMAGTKLLLLDEPFEGLAPIIVEELTRAIRRMRSEEGTAFVLVEQHSDVALGLTEQAVVIERGSIVHRAESAVLLREAATLERLIGLGIDGA